MDVSVMFWNVEHFSGTESGERRDRVDRIALHIADRAPHVFAIMEVTGAEVFAAFVKLLPNYSFFITEGPQTQEILVGTRRDVRAFVTQKNEFKRNNPMLRPGALVTLTTDGGEHLPILFNHLKSLTVPEGFGLRDAMIERALGLKRTLDSASDKLGQPRRFVLAGDLNTMGMDLKDSDFDIPATEEIARLERRFRRVGMRRLVKSHEATFFKGSQSPLPPSDLDHVFASSDLEFVTQSAAEVEVGGWAQLTDPGARDLWVQEYSDHAPLYFVLRDV